VSSVRSVDGGHAHRVVKVAGESGIRSAILTPFESLPVGAARGDDQVVER
jgi:hypothetical protein